MIGGSSGFASSRDISMKGLGEKSNDLSYLLDVAPKQPNNAMIVGAFLLGDDVESDDEELAEEEGRSERDYFNWSPTDFIPSIYNQTTDSSDESTSDEGELRSTFEETRKSLEATCCEVPSVEPVFGSSKSIPSYEEACVTNWMNNKSIPSYEEAYPTYWVNNIFVKSFVHEGGWLSKDLYLLRGLEHEKHVTKDFIQFIYKGQRIKTKARFSDDINKSAPHKDVKCPFNAKCAFNQSLNSVRDMQNHVAEKHTRELRALKRPLDPVVLNFENDGWYIYVQCGLCHKMPLFGWQRHVTISGHIGDNAKWNCLNVATKADMQLRTHIKWMEEGENRSCYQHKYYAILSKSLKKLYIGSTDDSLPVRFQRHRRDNNDVYELLCQDDCLITMFGMVEIAKISIGYQSAFGIFHCEYNVTAGRLGFCQRKIYARNLLS